MRRITRFAVVLFAIAALAWPEFATAAITAKQRATIRNAALRLTTIERLIKADRYEPAAERLPQVVKVVEPLAASRDAAVQRAFAALKTRIEQAHAAINLAGVKTPPLRFPKPADTPGDEPAASTDGASFVKHVAPMLVAKCARCHIDDRKGKFSMTDYAALMKGSEAGVVVMPRNAGGSRIVELIEQGDMPRGGAKVSKAELAKLKAWIAAGARFDGPNRRAPLKSLAAATTKPAEPKLKVVAATGDESSSYSRDVASVFAKHCANCHGQNNPRANFSVMNFRRLLRGGQAGAVIAPSKPAESLLIKKLKGTGGGARMPQNKPPLAAATIAKIEAWIAEGAKYDGQNADMPTADLVALYTARHASHEDLSKARAASAQQAWRLALPRAQPATHTTDQFLLYGADETKLKQAAEAARRMAAKVAEILKADHTALIKGRMTLFVFDKRYHYSEFGKMVEKRDLPRASRGHWRYSVVEAYGAALVPENDDESFDALLAQQIAGVYVASRGVKVPRWFAEGAARAVAAKVDSRDARVRRWDDNLRAYASGSPRPDAFLSGRLPPEEADTLSYGFANYLMSGANSRRFQRLLDALSAGESFDSAFAKVYRRAPAALGAAWVRRAATRGR